MKRLLIGIFCVGAIALSASTGFAADKYLCKWTNAQGSHRVTYTPGMNAETYCRYSKYVSEDAYKNCVEKEFLELVNVYNSGKCKKYMRKIHSDVNNSARCFVDVTDDPADGAIINCYGDTASTFRPKVEAMYRK